LRREARGQRAHVRTHRYARHALDAARVDEIVRARRNRVRREVDRGLTGAAEAVQRHARHLDRPAGAEHRRARDARSLLVGFGHAADDDVFDVARVDPRALDHRAHRRDAEVDRMDAGEASLAAAARRATGIDDEGIHLRRANSHPPPGQSSHASACARCC
jgi:hypothetical protein